MWVFYIQYSNNRFEAADWWSLGALMFDMLTGSPPFSADTKRETHDLILRGRISQPTGVSAEAKDLLKNLLKRNHATRLGSGETDALEIQVWVVQGNSGLNKLSRKTYSIFSV